MFFIFWYESTEFLGPDERTVEYGAKYTFQCDRSPLHKTNMTQKLQTRDISAYNYSKNEKLGLTKLMK